LSLGGVQLPSNIGDVDIPNLKTVEFNFALCHAEVDAIIQFSNCKNISFHQISTLLIQPNYYDITTYTLTSFWKAYSNILERCRNVRKIVASKYSAPLLLQLLRSCCEEKPDEIRSNWQGDLSHHTICFSSNKWRRNLGAGREKRLQDIDTLASSRGWNLALTGDAFCREWKRIVQVRIHIISFDSRDSDCLNIFRPAYSAPKRLSWTSLEWNGSDCQGKEFIPNCLVDLLI
jgi:hypothetical protein